jgi:hypothetical protein
MLPFFALGQYRSSQGVKMNDSVEQLSGIAPSERILLLPHCLRKSNTCQAKYDKHGLQCVECNADCSVNILRSKALKCGYKGVCVAPGGHLAIKFVEEYVPKAIVAVACNKELEEGIQEIKKMSEEHVQPTMVIVPLLKDGCIDTEVDYKKALEIISTGCIPVAAENNR